MKRLCTISLAVAAIIGFASQQRVTPVRAAAQAPVAPADAVGAHSYAEHCAICHGEQRQGILPGFPPLVGIGRKSTEPQIVALIHAGKGRMPGFPKLADNELSGLTRFLLASDQPMVAGGGAGSPAEAGGKLFQQSCSFCHGRDAAGGEGGPDLTRSKLVLADVGGNKISDVVRNGRIEKKMPAFAFSDQELTGLAAFIHAAVAKATAAPGGRRGVDVADLQTGSVQAGKQYFYGAGTCSTCHSPTGDLAGVASRHEGLELEERMLYPRDAKSRATVTLASGEKVTGTVAYLDEFTIGLRDAEGVYRSWDLGHVQYVLDAPAKKHALLFPNYTDKNIHDLMAYIQTLR